MKKKTIAIALAAVLVLVAVPALAFAASTTAFGPQFAAQGNVQPVLGASASTCARAAAGVCQGYTDTNNNGVCDSYDNGTCPGAQGNGSGADYGHHNRSNGHGHGNAHGCMNR